MAVLVSILGDSPFLNSSTVDELSNEMDFSSVEGVFKLVGSVIVDDPEAAHWVLEQAWNFRVLQTM